MIGKAHALRYEALSRLGFVLPQIPKSKGRAEPGPRGSAACPRNSQPATLGKLGISKRTANLARTLAALAPTELNAITSRDKTLAAVQREKKAVELEKRLGHQPMGPHACNAHTHWSRYFVDLG